jgi:hypothetical protein
MSEIKINALLLQSYVFLGVLEDLHQTEKGGQAHLVILGTDAGFQVLK